MGLCVKLASVSRLTFANSHTPIVERTLTMFVGVVTLCYHNTYSILGGVDNRVPQIQTSKAGVF